MSSTFSSVILRSRSNGGWAEHPCAVVVLGRFPATFSTTRPEESTTLHRWCKARRAEQNRLAFLGACSFIARFTLIPTHSHLPRLFPEACNDVEISTHRQHRTTVLWTNTPLCQTDGANTLRTLGSVVDPISCLTSMHQCHLGEPERWISPTDRNLNLKRLKTCCSW